MKFPLSWLKDYVDITCTTQELTDKLSLSGTEVESVIELGENLSGVVTGKIEKIEAHPNADRLVITQVSDGTNTHQVVTGAQNIFEGAIVPLSLPGAKLANNLKIKKGNLRGIASNGMLCSESELNVANESKGIWILPPQTPLGVDLIEYANIRDTILDISILPNRGDCQSIIGLAREIATLLKQPLKVKSPTPQFINSAIPITVENHANELCPLYIGQYIQLSQKQSQTPTPLWMQRRLQLCGLAPISLAVDITNYVLLEYGQPLHAFDASKINQQKLIIRLAKEGEIIQTLDQKERTLKEGMLIIADPQSPQAIAGILGGGKSEITDSTQNIFLEAAYFNATHIRKNSTTLGLRTESTSRFEKKVHLQGVETSSLRASELFQNIANAKLIQTDIKLINENEPLFQTVSIPFDAQKINAILGTALNVEEQIDALQSLGFRYNADTNTVTIPSWRQNDIQELPCLAEEIARLIGYDHIPTCLPQGFVPLEQDTPLERLKKQLQQTLQHFGFRETLTYPMISEEMIEKTSLPKQADALHIQNPLSEEQGIMRPSLLPSLLKVIKFNSTHQQHNLKLYEIGATYQYEDEKITEKHRLSAILTGDMHPHAYTTTTKKSWDFATLKEIVTQLLNISHKSTNITFQPIDTPLYHPIEALVIKLNTIEIGTFGRIHPQIQRRYKLTHELGYIEIYLDQLAQVPKKIHTYQSIPKTPSTRRDFAIITPKKMPYQTLLETFQKHYPKEVTETHLFDLFESEELGEDKKSLAFAFTYQDPQNSLSDEHVNQRHTTFIDAVLTDLPECSSR